MDQQTALDEERSVALAREWLRFQSAANGTFILFVGIAALGIGAVAFAFPVWLASPYFIPVATGAMFIILPVLRKGVAAVRNKYKYGEWTTPISQPGQAYIKRTKKVRKVLFSLGFTSYILALVSIEVIASTPNYIAYTLLGLAGISFVGQFLWLALRTGLWEELFLGLGLVTGFSLFICQVATSVPWTFWYISFLIIGFTGLVAGGSLQFRWIRTIQEKNNIVGWVW